MGILHLQFGLARVLPENLENQRTENLPGQRDMK